jgi:hypothetical protein
MSWWTFVSRGVGRRPKAVHWPDSLRDTARTRHTECDPASLHRLPGPLSRAPTTVSHALATAPTRRGGSER